jgi:hypothetical protein
MSRLEELIAVATDRRNYAEIDRLERIQERLRVIARGERPVELSPRGNSLSSLTTLFAPIAATSAHFAPALATVTPGYRLEQLELELYELLERSAPSTWIRDRRSLRRILRGGRRELRSIERQLNRRL